MLVWTALIVEILLATYCVLIALRERRSLLTFVESASDLDRLKEIAKRLPTAYRAPAAQFAGELARKTPLDETLVQAVIKTTNTPFGLGPTLRALVSFGIALIIFLPLAIALIDTSSTIAELKQKTPTLAGARAFLEARHELGPSFDALRRTIYRTAGLLSGLSLIGALHWWLNRAEAREARFVKALLEASIIARPGIAAPVGARLSELVAPDRGLRLPILTFAVFFIAPVVGGWSILRWTAGIRETNTAGVLDVWPKDIKTFEAPPSVRLPQLKGGGSIVKDRATLTIGKDAVKINSATFVELDPTRRLRTEWTAHRVTELDSIKGAGAEIRFSVLADKASPFETLSKVFERLHTEYRASHFSLIFDRVFFVSGASVRKIQAAFSLAYAVPGAPQPEIRLVISPSHAIASALGSQQTVRLGEPGWMRTLASVVQDPILKEKAPTAIRLEITDPNLTYDRLMEILAAVDSTCAGDTDDGSPGLGLRFEMRSPPRPSGPL